MVKIKGGEKPAWTMWQAIFISIIAIILSAITAALTSILIDGTGLSSTEKNFTVYAVNTATLLAIALLFIKRRKVSWQQFFKLPDKSALWFLPLYYTIYFLISVIIQAVFYYLPGYDAEQSQELGFTVGQGGLALIFVALVILPSLGEEVIFRGILYPGLKTRYKKLIAAMVTSILFGLAHFQWNVGVDTFVLSMVMIFALEKHKSLWLPIGLHAIKNFIAFVALFVFSS